jgi:hypothetical protein
MKCKVYIWPGLSDELVKSRLDDTFLSDINRGPLKNVSSRQSRRGVPYHQQSRCPMVQSTLVAVVIS